MLKGKYFYQLISKLNIIPIKIPKNYIIALDKLILKSIWETNMQDYPRKHLGGGESIRRDQSYQT